MTHVALRAGESQESLLRRFRKKVTKSRILSDTKKKRYFVSRSAQRRAARRRAVSRERKRQRKARTGYRR